VRLLERTVRPPLTGAVYRPKKIEPLI